jgi:hypothetical protein
MVGCASSGATGNGRVPTTPPDSLAAGDVAEMANTEATSNCVPGTLIDIVRIVTTQGIAEPALNCAIWGTPSGFAGDRNYRRAAAQAQAKQIQVTRLVTKQIERENAQLESAIQAAEQVVASNQQRLEQIKASLATKTISLDNARAQAAGIRANNAQVAALLNEARERRQNLPVPSETNEGGDVLDQQMRQLNAEISQLESQLDTMNRTMMLTGL